MGTFGATFGSLFGPTVGGIGMPAMSQFKVASLFAQGQQGVWFDNTDLSTMFSDAAFTTPAVLNGTVGSQHDKSGNGNHRTQATAGNRPTLRQRSDGVYYLDYTGGKSMSIPSSTGLFNYLHDGTGGTLIAFLEWEQGTSASNYINTSTSTTNVGIEVQKSTTTQSASYFINTGVSGKMACTISASRSSLSSGLRMLRFSYQNNGTASDGMASVDSGLTTYPAATANAPSTAAAFQNLQIATTFSAFEYGLIIRQGVLGSSDLAGIYRTAFKAVAYPVPNVDYTLILGGQSNMSGRGTVITTLPEDKLVGAYSYTKAEEFRVATIPEHSIENRPIATNPDEASITAPQHGFMLRAAKDLVTNSAKKVLLVPCAIGSTSIAMWDTPATANDRTTLFGAMVWRYQQAAAKGGQPIIVWYGHEADAGSAYNLVDVVNGGVGTVYQTAWAQLMADVRAYTSPTAPIVFCQLSADDTELTSEQQAAAGEALRQLELSLTNAYMVVTHDLQRNVAPDDIHISRSGVAPPLGDRISLAIRQHINGESVNGTGPRIVGATKTAAIVTLACNKAVNASVGNYGNLFRVYAGGVEQTVVSAVQNADTTKIDITCSATLTAPVTLTYGYRAGLASAPRTDFVMDSDSMPLPLFGPIVVN